MPTPELPNTEEILQTFKKILTTYDDIELGTMVKILNLPNEVELQKWLLEVADRFKFRISGNKVYFTSTISSDENIKDIEDAFRQWIQNSDKKIGKT